LGLGPVSFVIKKSRLRWFGYVDCNDNADWVLVEVDGCPKNAWWDDNITSSFIVVKTERLTFTTICHAG